MAHTVDSRPVANPARMVVAGPVCEASAISCTGLRLVEVKCSVRTWMTEARIRPNSTARNGFQLSMYTFERNATPTAEAAAERKNPRLMAFMPLSFSERGETD